VTSKAVGAEASRASHIEISGESGSSTGLPTSYSVKLIIPVPLTGGSTTELSNIVECDWFSTKTLMITFFFHI
jgi:hypothetical protein